MQFRSEASGHRRGVVFDAGDRRARPAGEGRLGHRAAADVRALRVAEAVRGHGREVVPRFCAAAFFFRLARQGAGLAREGRGGPKLWKGLGLSKVSQHFARFRLYRHRLSPVNMRFTIFFMFTRS